MASLITISIPTQRFELIRDSIGLIIKEELTNQKLLTSNKLFDANVYIERFVSFNHTELPAVNVIYDETIFSNKDNNSSTGEHQFIIDVVTASEDSSTERGDKLATLDLHKLLGVIRYILDCLEYRFLGLPIGVVQSKMVTKIKSLSPDNTYNVTISNDSLNSISGRIFLRVRANELTGDLPTQTVTSVRTDFTLEDSGLGYRIVVNNTII